MLTDAAFSGSHGHISGAQGLWSGATDTTVKRFLFMDPNRGLSPQVWQGTGSDGESHG